MILGRVRVCRLWEYFHNYLKLWDKEERTVREENEIIEKLMYQVSLLLDGDSDPSYLKGCALGVMKRVREIADSH